VARKKIVKDLEKLGLLERVEEYQQTLPRGDRSGAVIEPYLTDQWYVDIKPLAKPAIEAVESGKIRFIPETWSKTYFEWMYNIKDWAISRQLWWGHRIPAWYDEDGNIYVARDESEARKKYDIDDSVALRQDEDVLDTWFSSGMWPFTTQGWPQETESLKLFYPGQVLVTGFDIIFFWVARMIMLGLKFMDEVPFHEVYIHGLIRDHDGQKMSKSKGNVLDPLDLIDGVDLDTLLEKRTTGLMQPHLKPKIEKATKKEFPNGIDEYGADALRFTFASLATTGRDIRFDLGRIEGYKNFCNKLWNASRYVLMNTEALDKGDAEYSAADKWIRSRLHAAVTSVHENIGNYRFDLVAQTIYEFTWHEFCDWYLELSKPVLQSDSSTDEQKRGTRLTLIEVLEELLRLLHPVMPFITEEIWGQVAPIAGKEGDTIMLQEFPGATTHPTGPDVEEEIEWVRQFILGIRQIRGEMDISPGKLLPVLLENSAEKDRKYAEKNEHLLTRVGRVESVRSLAADEEAPASATALLGNMRLLVPMAGLIDIDAEKARLGKQRERVAADLGRIGSKLDNPNFVNNAPADVVTKTRQQLAELELQISQLDEQLARLEGIS
jgi:valyl-tRNA synthetase